MGLGRLMLEEPYASLTPICARNPITVSHGMSIGVHGVDISKESMSWSHLSAFRINSLHARPRDSNLLGLVVELAVKGCVVHGRQTLG
ncbi:hypothetical protein VNO77_01975 [Canavalia gladiata]|uniref:Uncharacterized protein n=1 Tax=Canavalia gladiata TaxID=3824 RepID=A0AAN9RAU2_CANGL